MSPERARMLVKSKVSMHVETVVLLSKKNVESFVEIGVDIEEYYKIKNAKSKTGQKQVKNAGQKQNEIG